MNRRCGDCTLCCKLLPVRELEKLAGERCAYQRHGKGCAVYQTPKMPPCCSLWSCRWLVDEATAGLARPDRSHYVIDLMPDYVQVRDNESGEKTPIEVVQIWVDPNHRDAHRDPALRAYLAKLGEEKGAAALIRYNNREGFAIFPPAMTGGHWREVTGGELVKEHSVADVVRTLGGKLSIEVKGAAVKPLPA